jgi:hypothetical protein
LGVTRQGSTAGSGDGIGEETLARIAEKLLRFRQHRNQILGSEIFQEPAWEIQLAVLSNGDAPTGTSFEELSERINCSPTLLCRWINLLLDRGLVEKRLFGPDPRLYVTQAGKDTFQAIVAPFMASGFQI